MDLYSESKVAKIFDYTPDAEIRARCRAVDSLHDSDDEDCDQNSMTDPRRNGCDAPFAGDPTPTKAGGDLVPGSTTPSGAGGVQSTRLDLNATDRRGFQYPSNYGLPPGPGFRPVDFGEEHNRRAVERVWIAGLWRAPTFIDEQFDEYQVQLQSAYD